MLTLNVTYLARTQILLIYKNWSS